MALHRPMRYCHDGYESQPDWQPIFDVRDAKPTDADDAVLQNPERDARHTVLIS